MHLVMWTECYTIVLQIAWLWHFVTVCAEPANNDYKIQRDKPWQNAGQLLVQWFWQSNMQQNNMCQFTKFRTKWAPGFFRLWSENDLYNYCLLDKICLWCTSMNLLTRILCAAESTWHVQTTHNFDQKTLCRLSTVCPVKESGYLNVCNLANMQDNTKGKSRRLKHWVSTE